MTDVVHQRWILAINKVTEFAHCCRNNFVTRRWLSPNHYSNNITISTGTKAPLNVCVMELTLRQVVPICSEFSYGVRLASAPMGFWGFFFFFLPNPICSAFSPAEKHSTERAWIVFTVPKHDHRTRKDKRHMATVEEGEATEVRGEEMKVQRSRNGTQRERVNYLKNSRRKEKRATERISRERPGMGAIPPEGHPACISQPSTEMSPVHSVQINLGLWD